MPQMYKKILLQIIIKGVKRIFENQLFLQQVEYKKPDSSFVHLGVGQSGTCKNRFGLSLLFKT